MSVFNLVEAPEHEGNVFTDFTDPICEARSVSFLFAFGSWMRCLGARRITCPPGFRYKLS